MTWRHLTSHKFTEIYFIFWFWCMQKFDKLSRVKLSSPARAEESIDPRWGELIFAFSTQTLNFFHYPIIKRSNHLCVKVNFNKRKKKSNTEIFMRGGIRERKRKFLNEPHARLLNCCLQTPNSFPQSSLCRIQNLLQFPLYVEAEKYTKKSPSRGRNFWRDDYMCIPSATLLLPFPNSSSNGSNGLEGEEKHWIKMRMKRENEKKTINLRNFLILSYYQITKVSKLFPF